jgi:hypothetical protein
VSIKTRNDKEPGDTGTREETISSYVRSDRILGNALGNAHIQTRNASIKQEDMEGENADATLAIALKLSEDHPGSRYLFDAKTTGIIQQLDANIFFVRRPEFCIA